MANTQTTVPTFTASQVLEAQQLNDSAVTGVPVFATTVTRDAAFGGAGQKALAQGQLCYLEATDVVQYYNGSAWATLAPAPAAAAGLTFLAKTTLTSATTTFSNVFSASYDNYLIIGSSINSSVGGNLDIRLGSTSSGYAGAFQSLAASYTAGAAGSSSWQVCHMDTTTTQAFSLTLSSPFLALKTIGMNISSYYSNAVYIGAYQLNDTTSYTDFSILGPASFATGFVTVYGYANS